MAIEINNLRGSSWASANDLRISDSSGHSDSEDEDVDVLELDLLLRPNRKTGLGDFT